MALAYRSKLLKLILSLLLMMNMPFLLRVSFKTGEPEVKTDSSQEGSNRTCFSSRKDFSQPLAGKWKQVLRQPPWWKLQCKFQSATSSCSYYEYPTDTRALRLAKSRFAPFDCDLKAFDSNNFLRSLQGKQLVIAGDSLSDQFFTSLLCRLESHVVEEHIPWGNISHRMKGWCGPNKKCMPDSGIHSEYEESYDNPVWVTCRHNVTIRLISIRHISIKKESWNDKLTYISSITRPSDLVVLNRGAYTRQNGYADFEANMEDLASFMVANQKVMPTIWWRESNPKHFQGLNGDYVPRKKLPSTDKTCVKPSHLRLHPSHVDPVNEISNRIMKSINIPIMYSAHSMLSEHNAHAFRSGLDCTHLCSPGVEVMWVDVLYGWLISEHRHLYL